MNFTKINSTYLYSALFFIGYWNLVTYYGNFNIEITNYIDTLEILFAFLKITNYFTFILGLLLIILIPLLLISLVIVRNIKEEDKNDDGYTVERFKKYKRILFSRNVGWKNKLRIFFVGTFIILLSDFAIKFFIIGYVLFRIGTKIYEGKEIYEYLGSVLVLEILSIGYFLFKVISEQLEKRRNQEWAFLLLISLMFSIYVNNWASSDFLKKGNLTKIVEFRYEGKKIQTNTANRYIGSTQRYIFIYDLGSKSTLIYPVEKLSEISFSSVGSMQIDF